MNRKMALSTNNTHADPFQSWSHRYPVCSTGSPLVPGLCLAVLVFCAFLPGCDHVDPTKGYSTRSLYADNIRTVHVAMFDNQTFRRGIEFELTRAVSLQIELNTPFKVIADRHRADTILSGTILSISETTLAQQRDLDRPLENQVIFSIELTWKDLRSAELLLDKKRIKATGDYAVLAAAGRDTASRQAVNEIAAVITELMQASW